MGGFAIDKKKQCTDGKNGNYDLTIIIFIYYYNLNFNVGLSDDSKK